MAAYKIFFRKSVEKDLEAIPRKDLKRIMQWIGGLAEAPRSHGCEKLTGQARYRLRHGSYRIVYSIEDNAFTVWVVKVGHRKDISR
jgi:mRNA interferase RelE/StbE